MGQPVEDSRVLLRTTEHNRSKRGGTVVRGIAGVLSGYLIFAFSAVALFQLTKHDPHGPASVPFMVGSIVYGMVFACIGGYAAQAIGARNDMRVTYALAILLATIAAVSIIADYRHFVWSAVGALVLMAPSVMAGGAIRHRRESKSPV